MKKERLDILLTDRGLVESRSLAQKLVMAGNILVNGQPIFKPASKVDLTSEITVQSGPKFVSRGGEKLEPALESFGFTNLEDKICADLGSSTGGFTDCMLQHGAKRVYAVDVGYGILHWKLRNDARVVVMERTNARYIKEFQDQIDLVTIDASFISLKTLLPSVKDWLPFDGNVIALIKPQFEAGKQEAAKGAGVIRDQLIHKKIIHDILTYVLNLEFDIKGLLLSPLKGPKGNIEFLVHLQKVKIQKSSTSDIELFMSKIFTEDDSAPV
ncbi:MAG: TlyA family RNA methyltransferase [Anaerolineaceae bacterium]|jgi:23S rRNA (cytidine1920-2'-O)/16S rRNA (cytidine1409-2'-O)-methyltransferase|nr:MAG: TlyA family rRNA (cytidine-2'-O)-methyltransferase [Chloroflexi bacterium HGW-Chloroflexi-8]